MRHCLIDTFSDSLVCLHKQQPFKEITHNRLIVMAEEDFFFLFNYLSVNEMKPLYEQFVF